jgi:hypothetical protein
MGLPCSKGENRGKLMRKKYVIDAEMELLAHAKKSSVWQCFAIQAFRSGVIASGLKASLLGV